MKEGWEIRKLGEVCSLITKGTTPTSIGFDFTDSGVNFVKVESFTEDGCIVENKVTHISNGCNDALKRSQLQENDILFSIAGALGRVAIVNKNVLPANTNQALAIIRLFDKNTNFLRYIYHYFHSELIINQINKFKGGVAQQNLSLKQLSDLEILIPPLSEQQRIVSKLDSAFEKIDALKANAENNLKNAKDLFQQVLKKELEPKDGWKEEVFENTLQKVSYTKKIKSVEYKKNGRFPVVSQEHQLISGYWDNPDDVFYISRAVVIFGDHTKEVKFVDFDFVLGADGVKILMTKPYIDSKYFYYFVKNLDIDTLGYARHYRLLKEKNVFYPSLSEQQRIVSILDSLSEKCKRLEENYRKTLAECDALKQAVLREVINDK